MPFELREVEALASIMTPKGQGYLLWRAIAPLGMLQRLLELHELEPAKLDE